MKLLGRYSVQQVIIIAVLCLLVFAECNEGKRRKNKNGRVSRQRSKTRSSKQESRTRNSGRRNPASSEESPEVVVTKRPRLSFLGGGGLGGGILSRFTGGGGLFGPRQTGSTGLTGVGVNHESNTNNGQYPQNRGTDPRDRDWDSSRPNHQHGGFQHGDRNKPPPHSPRGRSSSSAAAVDGLRGQLSQVPESDLRRGMVASLNKLSSEERRNLIGHMRDPPSGNIQAKVYRGSPLNERDLEALDSDSLQNLALLLIAYEHRADELDGREGHFTGGRGIGSSSNSGGGRGWEGGRGGGSSSISGGRGRGGGGGGSSSSVTTSYVSEEEEEETDSSISLTDLFSGKFNIMSIFSGGGSSGGISGIGNDDTGLLGALSGGGGLSPDLFQSLLAGLKREDENFDFDSNDTDFEDFEDDDDTDFENFGDDDDDFDWGDFD